MVGIKFLAMFRLKLYGMLCWITSARSFSICAAVSVSNKVSSAKSSVGYYVVWGVAVASLSKSFSRSIIRHEVAMMYRSGDKGHTCLIPISCLNSSLMPSVILILNRGF